MSIRLYCASCRAAFLVADDRRGASVACPKCNATLEVPPKGQLSPGLTPLGDGSRSGAETDEPASRPRRLPLALVAVAALGTLGLLAAWLRPWESLGLSKPLHPTEAIAAAYLQALVDEDLNRVRALGTIADPPAIRSFDPPIRDGPRSRRLRASFAPIAGLHARIDRQYQFDPELGRFRVRNALVPAAETLDALHAAKAKAKEERVYEKMASGDPDDLFDAAESFGSLIGGLAEGVLSPQRLMPTYEQLVTGSKPPLPPVQSELALGYAQDPETWDALLKRPFATLKADGPFVLDRADVTARVHDKLASSGDPPVTLRLTLLRFRLEGIDTGWKVIAAHRDQPIPSTDSSQNRSSTPPAEPRSHSPGEISP